MKPAHPRRAAPDLVGFAYPPAGFLVPYSALPRAIISGRQDFGKTSRADRPCTFIAGNSRSFR